MTAPSIARIQPASATTEVFERVATAVQTLCTAASGNLGTDCIVHACLAKGVLSRLGIKAEICIGESAWRLGQGEQDVVSHLFYGFNGPQVGFHAWLEIDGIIFDITTYLLPEKARQLDAMDGGKTDVKWAPKYLLSTYEDTIPFEQIGSRDTALGSAYYLRLPKVESAILASLEPDEGDEEAAWICYQNKDIKVVGPNNRQH